MCGERTALAGMDMPMRVRVIGASGRMGQIHCETYRELGLEIVGSIDDADIVSIASPDQTHGEYVISALEDGRHVFCEKPLCTNLSEMKEIEDRCGRHSNLHIGQNFPLRYRFDSLKDWDQILGKIYRAEFVYEWARSYKLGKGWRVGDYSLVMGVIATRRLD